MRNLAFLLGCPFSSSLLLILLLSFIFFVPTSETSMVLPGCPSKCGNVEVPYPFGFLKHCSRDESFLFTCNNTHYNPPELFLGNINIRGIYLTGHVNASFFVDRHCYDKEGNPLNAGFMYTDIRGTSLTISADRNYFTVSGCDTLAFIEDPDKENGFWTGCASLCRSLDMVKNNTCSGIGCCQTSIPQGLKYYEAKFQSFYNHTQSWHFNPCSLAFLVDKGNFVFNTSLLSTNYTYKQPKLPVVLDWAIEGKDCQTAKQDSMTYACRSNNSECVASNNELGYHCNCSSGYQGNPFIADSCQDIDECKNPQVYPCKGVCTNVAGTYNCSCPPGFQSADPKTQNCFRVPGERKLPLWLSLITGLGSGLLFLMMTCSWLYWGFQKRKLMNLKQRCFEENGGLFLEEQISSDNQTNFRVFTERELAKATNNFDKGKILGSGAQGIVYKGTLDGNRTIAIKRSTVAGHGNKAFAREIFILSKINHKNVVKILGCCLEVEFPMVVYEFILNGTLFDLIYDEKSEFLNSFDARLRIAKEAAEALAYLHSEASPPILHGDVKPSNILLDTDYTVKVSDFGTSTLAPNDKARFTTLVQGTFGYLDPEYMQTCRLTEKSDVYSFGVVLVELLTRRDAFNFDGSEGTQSTASTFISCMKDSRLFEILDNQITKEEWMNQVQKVAVIANRCLRLKGDDRPTMKEVVMELEFLQRNHGEHPESPAFKEQPGNKMCNTSESFSSEPGGLQEIGVGR